jgi:hypothetical protein
MAILDREVETQHVQRTYPRLTERSLENPLEVAQPNGAAAAAILASGIGSVLYGLIVLLAESNKAISDLLVLSKAVGPLSGKSTFGVLAWLVVWGLLHLMWRHKNVNFSRVWMATLVLIGVSLVLTFPLFFMLFAAE